MAMWSIRTASEALVLGRTTSRALVEECLAAIDDASGEGARAFVSIHRKTARAAAEYHDVMRRHGAAVSPFAGIPISVKDLFDVAGDVTTAGSQVLQDSPPASTDAVAVSRLRSAGFIPIGRSNMTEFAYSGLGLNPHFGTPLNPYERNVGRIPGGSSSGAAISVTDGMAIAALGTDTGGSCRIPAALTGIVGFKPTSGRVPLDGVVPLSPSLDSVGWLARTTDCCAIVDAILTGEPIEDLEPPPLATVRLGLPGTLLFDDLDKDVAVAVESALSQLAGARVRLVNVPVAEFADIQHANAKGGFAAAEAYAWHRGLLAQKGPLYDPRVSSRILRGKEQDAAEYIELCRTRREIIVRFNRSIADVDALIAPTVPAIAPTVASLEADTEYTRMNLLMLRNPAVVNFVDGCAISAPCHHLGDPPVGLMLIGRHSADRRLLALAASVEACLSSAIREPRSLSRSAAKVVHS